jgi:hypothetical protein
VKGLGICSQRIEELVSQLNALERTEVYSAELGKVVRTAGADLESGYPDDAWAILVRVFYEISGEAVGRGQSTAVTIRFDEFERKYDDEGFQAGLELI